MAAGAAASAVSKGGNRGRGEPGRVGVCNGTGIFRSFRLEREKRNTSEEFHLFSETFR